MIARSPGFNVPTSLSLFTGAMGLDLGLAMSLPHRALAMVERDAAACSTLRANLGEGTDAPLLVEGSVTDLCAERLMADLGLRRGDLDLIVGGPPCQSFSTVGSRRSTADERGTLAWDFLRFVRAFRPKAFVMENVRGFLSARDRATGTKGGVWQAFARDAALGGEYHVTAFLTNAANHGSAQSRERLVVVANRLDRENAFADPDHGPGRARPWRTLGDALEGLVDPTPEVLEFSARKRRYLEMIPPGGNWRSLPHDVARESMGRAFLAKGGRSGWWRRLSFDLPCPTLVTAPNHASTSLCHPTRTRALSVAEYAAIQGFPADWRFAGTLADRYRQIGNAVPIELGRAAGLGVGAVLRGETGAIGTATGRIEDLGACVRTKRWSQTEGAKTP